MSYTPFSIDNILADNVPKRRIPLQGLLMPAVEVTTKDLSPLTINTQNESHPVTPKNTEAKNQEDRSSSPSSSASASSRNSISPAPSTGSEGEQEEGKKKKARTSFTVYQIDQLERTFAAQRYLGAAERSHLAEVLNLSDHQVKTWFQNRRMKEKRQIREAEERLGHPVTSLPSHMATVPSHVVMSPSHPFSRLSLPSEPPFLSSLSGHVVPSYLPVPPMGSEMFSSYPASLASMSSQGLCSHISPLRVQVGF